MSNDAHVQAVFPTRSDHSRRLDRVVTEYLKAVEAGANAEPAEWLARYPELADELRAFFAGQEEVDRLAAPLRPPVQPWDMATLAPGEAAPDDAVLGRVRYFGDYELLEEVARGGMGVVFKARQVSLNRIVALKMILAGQLASDADVKRFRAEAEAAANLRHPNIVSIHEIGAHEGQHFFSMDYVVGPSLAGLVRDQPLAPRRATALVETVAGAVDFAHRKGVLHRDLKPSNILLDEAGVPHVTDFGLAKKIEQKSELTATGAILGTPSYMPPEQAAGKGAPLSPACDVYSLGAVLYELVTGRPPFRAETPLETVLQVLDHEPVAPRLLNPAVPRDLETICLKCLQKEPAKRYATAAAMSDDLKRFLSGEPITARPISSTERLWCWCRRNPRVASLVVAIAVLMVGVSIVSSFAAVQMQEARRQAEDRAAVEAQARKEAEQAQAAEAELRKQAQAALERAEASLYLNRIALAERYWNSNNSTRADQLLEQCKPELRNWEWHYLKRLQHPELLQMPGDQVAYSPDGKLLATDGKDNTIHLRDAQTGKVLTTLRGEDRDRYGQLAFRPDGKLLGALSWKDSGRPNLIVTDEKSVQLWDVASGKLVRKLTLVAEYATAFAFSPDGGRVALATGRPDEVHGGLRPGVVVVWDAGSGKELWRQENRGLAVAFSPDGKRLATAARKATGWLGPDTAAGTQVVDAATGQPLFRVPIDGLDDHVIAYSPDGKYLALGRRDRIVLCDPATGKTVKSLQAQGMYVAALAFSRDGRRVACGSGDETVRIWDVGSGKELNQLRGHKGTVGSVALHPDGRIIASGGVDETVRLWDVDRAPGARAVPSTDHWNDAAVVSPDGRYVARVADRPGEGLLGSLLRSLALTLVDTATGKEVRVLRTYASDADAKMAFSADSRLVAVGLGNEVQVWDVASGKETAKFRAAFDGRGAVAFSPDGRRLAFPAEGQAIEVWDVLAAKRLARLEGVTGSILGLTFSPDGTRIAAAGVGAPRPDQNLFQPGAVKVWNALTGRHLVDLAGHTLPVAGVAFAPDGKHLATASWDQTARLWDAATGKEVRVLRGHTGYVTGVAFTPDGRRLATCGYDRQVKLWETATGEEVLSLPTNDAFSDVTFVDHGRVLAAMGRFTHLLLWDATPLTERPVTGAK